MVEWYREALERRTNGSTVPLKRFHSWSKREMLFRIEEVLVSVRLYGCSYCMLSQDKIKS
jgi:hypothetical protein